MSIIPLWLFFSFASSEPCRPDAVFAAVRSATGGDRWNAVGGIIGDGDASAAGLQGPAHVSIDVRTGRSAERADLPFVHETRVYDGRTQWIVNGEDGVHPLDAPDAAAGARTDAYLARRGYFSPATDPADFACLDEGADGARHFDVVRVTPHNARPVDVWVDQQTHRIARTVQRTPTVSEITTYADYRDVDGIALPFLRTTADDDGSGAETVRFVNYHVVPHARDSDFIRPPEPTNFRMNGGATSTTVPISLDNGILSVLATVDGKGPFPFILDTGGHAILTLDTLATLGLSAVGKSESGGGGEGKTAVQFAQSRSIRIGDAELLGIPMTVLGIHGDELGPHPAGAPPLAGILGLEVFERFAVRVDYIRKTLTLTPLRTFRYHGSGVPLRLVFQQDAPLVDAQADGYDGLFMIDTGNSGTTILIGHFLEQHGFFDRYHDGIASTGGGTGGVVHASTQALDRLTIAGQTLHNFPASFVVQQRGSFSSLTEAGNIGTAVLSQFTPTFDYRDETIYFERENGAPIAPQSRAGFSYSQTADGMTIGTVLPQSAAAVAGLTALCPSAPQGCSPWVEPGAR